MYGKNKKFNVIFLGLTMYYLSFGIIFNEPLLKVMSFAMISITFILFSCEDGKFVECEEFLGD